MGRGRGGAVALAVEGLLDLTKSKPRVQSFGRFAQQADGGVGGASQAFNPIEEATELHRTGQISTREMNSSIANGTTPKRWNELDGTNTYNSLEKGEVSEYARAIQQKHNAIEPTRTTPIPKELEGISNPRHIAVGQEYGEILETTQKFSAKQAERVSYYENLAKTIEDKYNRGELHVRADGSSRKIKRGDFEKFKRRANDWKSSPLEAQINEWVDSLQARTGYKNRAMMDKPGGPVSGQAGLDVNQIIEQHHAIGNAEGGALFSQTEMLSDLFKLNAWQYVAQTYKTSFGKTAANMWNLPKQIHFGKKVGLHAWLTDMGFDTFFRDLLKKNPNMSQQEIMDSIDRYFEEIFDPSIIKAENMIMGWPKKHKWKGIHLPKEVLKDAKQRLTDFTLYEEARFDPIMEGIQRGEGWALQRRGQLDSQEGYVTARNLLGENRALSAESPSQFQ